MVTYRILSIDGGGIRGVLPAQLLQRLEESYTSLIEETDLIAGNSAGSFVALGLAAGYSPKEIVHFFQEYSPEIFGSRRWFSWVEPKYGNKGLIKAVKGLLGDRKLSDLNKKVVIPSFALDNEQEGHWQPVFYHNFEDSIYKDMLIRDVALASSAAPTYFPSYNKMIDGGVFANNPSTLGVGFAISKTRGNQQLTNLSVLSLGTGFLPYKISKNTKRWGEFQWIGVRPFYSQTSPHDPPEPLIDVLMDGVAGVDDALTGMIVGDRYFRLNPIILDQVGLDEYQKIPYLIQVAEEADLSDVTQFLDTVYLRKP